MKIERIEIYTLRQDLPPEFNPLHTLVRACVILVALAGFVYSMGNGPTRLRCARRRGSFWSCPDWPRGRRGSATFAP